MVELPRADYEDFVGSPIISIRGLERVVWSDGTLLYDEVVIEFEAASLSISADINTSEIVTKRVSRKARNKWKEIADLSFLIGSRTDCSWIGHSNRGCSDMFIVSIDKIGPALMFFTTSIQIMFYRIEILKTLPKNPI